MKTLLINKYLDFLYYIEEIIAAVEYKINRHRNNIEDKY